MCSLSNHAYLYIFSALEILLPFNVPTRYLLRPSFHTARHCNSSAKMEKQEIRNNIDCLEYVHICTKTTFIREMNR